MDSTNCILESMFNDYKLCENRSHFPFTWCHVLKGWQQGIISLKQKAKEVKYIAYKMLVRAMEKNKAGMKDGTLGCVCLCR